jgi:hypothetical protein
MSGAAAVEEAEKVPAVNGPSQHPKNGTVRVEGGKPRELAAKKKPKKRTAGAKKRGTGFEGKSWCLIFL